MSYNIKGAIILFYVKNISDNCFLGFVQNINVDSHLNGFYESDLISIRFTTILKTVTSSSDRARISFLYDPLGRPNLTSVSPFSDY